MRLYVGNIPFSTTEEELRLAFLPYGEVEKVAIVSDRETGRARGFAFVDMPTDNEARSAMEKLGGQPFGGRAMVVNQAKEKPRAERSNWQR